MGLDSGIFSDAATMAHVWKFAYSPDADLDGTPLASLTSHQRKIISATVHVRNNVKQFFSKVAEARVTEFLSATARDDATKVKQVGHGVLTGSSVPVDCRLCT